MASYWRFMFKEESFEIFPTGIIIIKKHHEKSAATSKIWQGRPTNEVSSSESGSEIKNAHQDCISSDIQAA